MIGIPWRTLIGPAPQCKLSVINEQVQVVPRAGVGGGSGIDRVERWQHTRAHMYTTTHLYGQFSKCLALGLGSSYVLPYGLSHGTLTCLYNNCDRVRNVNIHSLL